jgi:hypothetical protein
MSPSTNGHGLVPVLLEFAQAEIDVLDLNEF